MNLYSELNKLKSNIYFKKYSEIYVDEFFMYLFISSSNNYIFPTIEIYNILSNLTINLIDEINNILCLNNFKKLNICNFKYFYNESLLINGQENLIKLMKDIFNHNCISEKIEKINLNIIYNDIKFKIYIYNNDKIIDVKNNISEYLLINNSIKINVNRIILKFNKLIIENINKELNFYNIKNNSILYVLINMDNKSMI